MNRAHQALAVALSFEFHGFLMEHPSIAARIPRDSLVVLTIEGRTSFNRWSRSAARQQARPGQKIVEVHVRRLAPPVSRIQALEVSLPVRGKSPRILKYGA